MKHKYNHGNVVHMSLKKQMQIAAEIAYDIYEADEMIENSQDHSVTFVHHNYDEKKRKTYGLE
jgi:hypothetical protein